MSGWADDLEAEYRMTCESHRRLATVDPQNKWLGFFDRSTSELQGQMLIEQIWDEKWGYGTMRFDLFRLLCKYRAKMDREPGLLSKMAAR